MSVDRPGVFLGKNLLSRHSRVPAAIFIMLLLISFILLSSDIFNWVYKRICLFVCLLLEPFGTFGNLWEMAREFIFKIDWVELELNWRIFECYLLSFKELLLTGITQLPEVQENTFFYLCVCFFLCVSMR